MEFILEFSPADFCGGSHKVVQRFLILFEIFWGLLLFDLVAPFIEPRLVGGVPHFQKFFERFHASIYGTSCNFYGQENFT